MAFRFSSPLFLLLFLYFGAATSPPAESPKGNKFPEAQKVKTWCVAKPSTEEAALQENIDFACNHVDCTAIRGGSACGSPNTLINHASVAMNMYYQTMGRNHWNCHFMNSGLVVQTDPSYGGCVYL